MKQYELIKSYPGSPALGTKVSYSEIHKINNYNGGDFYSELPKHQVENLPEFWKEIEEDYVGVCFKHYESETLYKIVSENGDGYTIVWKTSDTDGAYYNKMQVIKYFTEGTWIKISNEEYDAQFRTPILITEDGVNLYLGSKYYTVFNKKVSTDVKPFIVYGEHILDLRQKNKEYCKYFSTKEEAQEYIDYNKPIYSKNHIYTLLDSFNVNWNTATQYKDKIKQYIDYTK